MSDDPSDYHIVIFWSEDDGCYVSAAPDLPGCVAAGHSRESAAEEIEYAITAWIEACQEAGNNVPVPSRFEFSSKGPVRS